MKKYIFNLHLKNNCETAIQMSLGRSFHKVRASNAKLHLRYFFSLIHALKTKTGTIR